MLAVVRGEYIAPTAIVPGFPPGLERVIKAALAVDKNKRYASAAALLEALEGLAAAEDWQLQRRAIAALMPSCTARRRSVRRAPHRRDHRFGDRHDDDADEPDSESDRRRARRSPSRAIQATVIITRPRRLARGTESDVSDDQPTRGRRSLPAIFAPRVAA